MKMLKKLWKNRHTVTCDLLCLVLSLFSFHFLSFAYRLYHSGFTQTNCSLLVKWWESWLSHLPLPKAHDPLFWFLELPDFTDHGPGPISCRLLSTQVKIKAIWWVSPKSCNFSFFFPPQSSYPSLFLFLPPFLSDTRWWWQTIRCQASHSSAGCWRTSSLAVAASSLPWCRFVGPTKS